MQTLDSVFWEDERLAHERRNQKKLLWFFILFSICDSYIGGVLNVKFINGIPHAPHYISVSLMAMVMLVAALVLELTGRKKWFLQLSLTMYVFYVLAWALYFFGFINEPDSRWWDLVYIGARAGIYIGLVTALLSKPYPADLHLKVVMLVNTLQIFLLEIGRWIYVYASPEAIGFFPVLLVLLVFLYCAFAPAFRKIVFLPPAQPLHKTAYSKLFIVLLLIGFIAALAIMFLEAVMVSGFLLRFGGGGAVLPGLFIMTIPSMILLVSCFLPFKLNSLYFLLAGVAGLLLSVSILFWYQQAFDDKALISPVLFIYIIKSCVYMILISSVILVARHHQVKLMAVFIAFCNIGPLLVKLAEPFERDLARLMFSPLGFIALAALMAAAAATCVLLMRPPLRQDQKSIPS